MRPSNNLFVYGTLKVGGSNYRLLAHEGVDFLGSATTKEFRFRMIGKGRSFPMVVTPGEHAIRGHLFRVENESVWHNLDRLEGVPHFYNHEPVKVSLDDSPDVSMTATMYLCNSRYVRDETSFDKAANNILWWEHR